jgi:hypothetical protein
LVEVAIQPGVLESLSLKCLRWLNLHMPSET